MNQEDILNERKINGAFFKDVPEYIFHHVRRVLASMLDREGAKLWSQTIYLYPMVERVAVYTYSPIEALDIRMILLGRWMEADIERKDLRNPQALHDAAFLVALANNQNIKETSLSTALRRMRDDFSCVFQADIRKAVGHPGSIRQLRDNWKQVKPIKGGKKTIIDQSPFFRIEHLDLEKKIEIYYYALERKTHLEDLFSEADAHLTEWFQWFGEIKVSKKPIWVYIHDCDGKLISPLARHDNPFIFNLMEKYQGLILSQKTDPGIAAIAFADKVLPEWKGDRPPAAHFVRTLQLRVKDEQRKEDCISKRMIRFSLLKKKDTEEAEDKSFKFGFTEQDQLKVTMYQDLKDRLRLNIKMLAEKSKNPTERIILELKERALDEEEEISHAKIAKIIEAKTGKKISRQYVQRIDSTLKARLKKLIK